MTSNVKHTQGSIFTDDGFPDEVGDSHCFIYRKNCTSGNNLSGMCFPCKLCNKQETPTVPPNSHNKSQLCKLTGIDNL
jgi:hypothetical protein